MSDALGQDQFQPVNRRAGYGDALEMALSAARKGWTLSAGQGSLIVEHYEKTLAATIGERESFMHRMYEARGDAERAERQFNIVTDMLVEQASLLTQYEEKLDHIDTLTRERDEARRDAERLDWLGKQMDGVHVEAGVAGGEYQMSWFATVYTFSDEFRAGTVREAIDKAMNHACTAATAQGDA